MEVRLKKKFSYCSVFPIHTIRFSRQMKCDKEVSNSQLQKKSNGNYSTESTRTDSTSFNFPAANFPLATFRMGML